MGNSNYIDLLNFIRENDLSESVNYKYVESQLDIVHYINYQIAEMYLNNYDWPVNNIKGWRSDDFNGKWRWMFFDLDAGFGNPDYNMFEHCTNEDTSIIWPNPVGSTALFRGLLRNEIFVQKFIERFTTLLHQNFQPNNILPQFLDIKKIYEPEIPRHIQRWTFPENMDTWENDIATECVNFIQERPCHIETQIKDFFNLDTLGFSCNREESNSPNFVIFPNPNNGLFFIENQSDNLFQGTITIYNTLG